MNYCCRKKAVCNGDQLLDFSVPELVWSQSTLSTDPEVLQNCAGFTLCSSVGLAGGECYAVMGLTPCMLGVQIYCVLCVLDYYLLGSHRTADTCKNCAKCGKGFKIGTNEAYNIKIKIRLGGISKIFCFCSHANMAASNKGISLKKKFLKNFYLTSRIINVTIGKSSQNPS